MRLLLTAEEGDHEESDHSAQQGAADPPVENPIPHAS